MPEMTDVHGLSVATTLKTFIDSEALPGTGLEPDAFWKNFSDLLNGLAPKNRELLAKRDALQEKLETVRNKLQALLRRAGTEGRQVISAEDKAAIARFRRDINAIVGGMGEGPLRDWMTLYNQERLEQEEKA